ncbi:MAG: hypothetical protein ACXAC2_22775, partial [Candidatus Kariarchaeaceae archaeon]
YEISGFDDIRFEILDLMSIADDSINKLIIASKSGIFQTKIEYTLDTHSIVSPICFTSEIYTKQELTPSSYPSITPKNIPVNHLTQVYYKLIGSNQWLSLGLQYARASKHEIRLDLSSVWSNLDYVRIAYGYDSFVSEERTAIDPSFQSYSGISDTQAKSISATFFDTSALPLLWLNPGTKYSDPNVKWHSLPNAMSYQSSPVISGYGNRVFYPTITSGWDYAWGSEYTNMPELENSLINYGGSYDSGELAQNLNSIDNYYGTSKFGDQFENNYIDDMWVSNPYMSETYDFPSMYYSGIHNEGNSTGVYNYYNGAQRVFLENELMGYSTYNTEYTAVFNSGTLPLYATSEYLNGFIKNWPVYKGYISGSLTKTYIDDSNYVQIVPESTGPTYLADIELTTSTSLNGDDFYFSFHSENPNVVGHLKINDYEYASGKTIIIDRVYIQNITSIDFYQSSSAYSDSTLLYYFKMERVTEGSATGLNPSLSYVDQVMSNWSKYIATSTSADGLFGFNFTYKLPLISRSSLDSIQLAFDASINSYSFEGGNYPLSIQIWNFDLKRWESIPVAPLSGPNYYSNIAEDYKFWRWVPNAESSPPTDKFRPDWGTYGLGRVNTISYGNTFPNTIDGSGNIVFDSAVEAGGSFLVNSDSNHQLNSLYSDDNKVLFYDDKYYYSGDEYNTNKFQLDSIIIDPNNFRTLATTNFPAYTNTSTFNSISSD